MMTQEWYFADNRYQRMVILAIARSQRPAHLTAYKFFMISMESFANVRLNHLTRNCFVVSHSIYI